MSDAYDDVVSSHEPMDRLTRLSEEMTTPLDREENSDVKAIVFLNNGERGGIQIYNYDNETEALTDVFIHMKAIFNSMGKDLEFVPIPDSPLGLDDL
jgi:hypothetical protein